MDSSAATPIRFSIPYVSGNELRYLEQVLASRNFAGNGPFTQRVQSWLETRFEVQRVLLTHSCTAALEMSALLLDLEPGDEVIMPSYTFCSTASAFARTPARIVFCEIDERSLMMDPDDLERRLSPRTRAVVPVHYAGLAADLPRIAELTSQACAVLVEDAAQGLDAAAFGRPLGTTGLFGCLSFHETKNLHAGLGGALFLNTDDDALLNRATQVWERGTNRQAQLRGLVDKYTWTELGSSFYPSELQAAFLLAQLESLDENRAARQALHEAYLEALTPLADAGMLALPPYEASHRINYHAFYVVFPKVAQCEHVRLALKHEDIAAYIGYVPLHSSPMGRKLGWKADDLPITEDVAQRVLRLPMHNEMSAEDVLHVAGRLTAHLGYEP